MYTWKVRGGNTLDGSCRVQGAKNAVLPIMAASLICPGETNLYNCPDLLDVAASVEILRYLGCRVEREGNCIHIDSRNAHGTHIPHELMSKMRSSVMFMGAILGRHGEVRLSTPGGCELGSRPIDLHLKAMEELGATVTRDGAEVSCRAAKLRGTRLNLEFPSVGATENAMLAACGAQGETVITNAAREPEICDLQDYLVKAGAEISGAGTPTITVSGFKPRDHVDHFVLPDRIAAATFACACAAVGGKICIKSMCPGQIATVLTSISQMGCAIIRNEHEVTVISRGRLRAARPVITKPYPGFPTDAQALMMVPCLRAEGTSVFVENIFENRYRHADEMRRFGADIRIEGRVAMITGVEKLKAAPVTACDLRGGAALIIAAMCAEGESTICDAGHVLRGYERFDTVLRSLGGDVECCT